MIERALIAAVLLVATPALADRYAIVCTASCVAPDGTTQSSGAVLGIVLWDGVSQWQPPPNTLAVPFAGQKPYVPAPSVATTVGSYDFINRFSAAEQQAIQTAAQSNWQLQIWMTQLAAVGSVDVTTAKIQSGVAALVAAGLVTQARAAQVMNLAVSSP